MDTILYTSQQWKKKQNLSAASSDLSSNGPKADDYAHTCIMSHIGHGRENVQDDVHIYSTLYP